MSPANEPTPQPDHSSAQPDPKFFVSYFPDLYIDDAAVIETVRKIEKRDSWGLSTGSLDEALELELIGRITKAEYFEASKQRSEHSRLLLNLKRELEILKQSEERHAELSRPPRFGILGAWFYHLFESQHEKLSHQREVDSAQETVRIQNKTVDGLQLKISELEKIPDYSEALPINDSYYTLTESGKYFLEGLQHREERKERVIRYQELLDNGSFDEVVAVFESEDEVEFRSAIINVLGACNEEKASCALGQICELCDDEELRLQICQILAPIDRIGSTTALLVCFEDYKNRSEDLPNFVVQALGERIIGNIDVQSALIDYYTELTNDDDYIGCRRLIIDSIANVEASEAVSALQGFYDEEDDDDVILHIARTVAAIQTSEADDLLISICSDCSENNELIEEVCKIRAQRDGGAEVLAAILSDYHDTSEYPPQCLITQICSYVANSSAARDALIQYYADVATDDDCIDARSEIAKAFANSEIPDVVDTLVGFYQDDDSETVLDIITDVMASFAEPQATEGLLELLQCYDDYDEITWKLSNYLFERIEKPEVSSELYEIYCANSDDEFEHDFIEKLRNLKTAASTKLLLLIATEAYTDSSDVPQTVLDELHLRIQEPGVREFLDD